MDGLQTGGSSGRRCSLLDDRWLLLADAGEAFLNQAREFFLAGELDLRVFLGHPDRAVAGDLRCLNARPTNLLPPCNIRPPERVRSESGEVAALCGRRPLQSLAHAGIPQREAAAVRSDEDPLVRPRLVRRGLSAVAINQVSQRERSFAGL